MFMYFYSSRSRSEQSLVRWATPQLHDIDALAKMVDPALKGLYPVKSLSRFADVIALCVQVTSQLLWLLCGNGIPELKSLFLFAVFSF